VYKESGLDLSLHIHDLTSFSLFLEAKEREKKRETERKRERESRLKREKKREL